MKIVNSTCWRMSDLRAFVVRVAAEELEPAQRRQLTVRFLYGRSGPSVSGRAACPGAWAKVFLSSSHVDRADLAHTLRHELAHTRGMRHDQMRGSPRYRRVGDWRAMESWAESLQLEKSEKSAPPSLEEQRAARLMHALAKLRQWELRLKGDAGRVRRWRGRVKAIERQQQQAALTKAST